MRAMDLNEAGSGQTWYDQLAFQALNQAIGRCIRHENDWGAILLVDSRISNYAGYITRWMKVCFVLRSLCV